MTDFDIQQISDDDLCNAGRRLQAAHDYIETNGFNIHTYEGSDILPTTSVVDYNNSNPHSCVIAAFDAAIEATA